MRKVIGRRKIVAVAGTMVLAGPALAACAMGPTYEQWAETDGAAGRINLEEVQEAFKKSESPSEFERRVNEIYEGDSLVLIRSSQDGDSLVLAGFEDLDDDGVIDDVKDDLLFSIVKESDSHELRGHGANGYYRNSFGAGNFLFTYMLFSALSPGRYYYQTPRGSVGGLKNNRNSYRGSSAYRTQVSRNSNHFSRQKSFHGSRYQSAGKNLSRGRQSYMSKQQSTGAFRTSRTGVRSSWGSRGSGGSFGRASRGGRGGFRGFGGAQRVIGLTRGA
jgi:hypothetical protein